MPGNKNKGVGVQTWLLYVVLSKCCVLYFCAASSNFMSNNFRKGRSEVLRVFFTPLAKLVAGKKLAWEPPIIFK